MLYRPLHVAFAGALFLVALSACGGATTTAPGPTSPTSSGDAPQEESSTTSEDSATLDILSDEPKDVLLDGKPIGKAPLTGIKVVPGSHDVTFVDPRSGNTTMSVNVGPNEAQIVKAPNTATKFGTPQD